MEPGKKVCLIFYKSITIFYHMGDLDYRFLPFERAYADYGILSRVRHFSAEKLQVTTILQRGFTLPELPSPTTICKISGIHSAGQIKSVGSFLGFEHEIRFIRRCA